MQPTINRDFTPRQIERWKARQGRAGKDGEPIEMPFLKLMDGGHPIKVTVWKANIVERIRLLLTGRLYLSMTGKPMVWISAAKPYRPNELIQGERTHAHDEVTTGTGGQADGGAVEILKDKKLDQYLDDDKFLQKEVVGVSEPEKNFPKKLEYFLCDNCFKKITNPGIVELTKAIIGIKICSVCGVGVNCSVSPYHTVEMTKEELLRYFNPYYKEFEMSAKNWKSPFSSNNNEIAQKEGEIAEERVRKATEVGKKERKLVAGKIGGGDNFGVWRLVSGADEKEIREFLEKNMCSERVSGIVAGELWLKIFDSVPLPMNRNTVLTGSGEIRVMKSKLDDMLEIIYQQ